MPMIDPSVIDAKIEAARHRDDATNFKLQQEVARLIVVKPFQEGQRNFSLDMLSTQIGPARYMDSGQQASAMLQAPEAGSYAMQLWSSICFMVDARVELKLLELIRSPDFYSALMRSAAEVQP